MDRRHQQRHRVVGPAHIFTDDGRMMGVDIRDISATGALVTLPGVDDIDVGLPVILAGTAMFWERTAIVVAHGAEGLHLQFAP